MDPNLTDFGRFSEPALLIMVSLADSPKHGYAMLEDIEQFYGLRPGPGTLYGALARLEQRGLIEALPITDRRQPYRLTAVGERVLEQRLTQLGQFAQAGLRRLETS